MTDQTRSQRLHQQFGEIHRELLEINERLDREDEKTFQRLKETDRVLSQRLEDTRRIEAWKKLPWYKQLFVPVPKPTL